MHDTPRNRRFNEIKAVAAGRIFAAPIGLFRRREGCGTPVAPSDEGRQNPGNARTGKRRKGQPFDRFVHLLVANGMRVKISRDVTVRAGKNTQIWGRHVTRNRLEPP